jgi:uncharacterized protein (DUF2252 family)
MSDQSLPKLSVAKIPPQTHIRTLEERLAIGKKLREKCHRFEQAEFKPVENRANPVDLLIESSRGRIEELLPIRYGRMMATPFTFYRGAAAIMAYDLSATPSTGLSLIACGDCHLLNFGGFATAERNVVFDINDFDEVSVAPWEWDLKRLTASFMIAGRSNGFSAGDCREAALLAAQSYRLKMAEYSDMQVMKVWSDVIDFKETIEQMKDKDSKRFYTKKLEDATKQSANEKEFAKMTFTKGDYPRIADEPPLIYHLSEIRDKDFRENIINALIDYRKTLSLSKQLLFDRFNLVDIAIKVVGVGSVGTVCGVLLFMSGNGDPLFLQFKQARQSVLEPYCGSVRFKHQGQRVVEGQHILQASSDIFLGWTTGKGIYKVHFYLRQLRDAKIKPVVEIMKQSNLKNYATLCGTALARAHARSADAAVLTGYMGKSTAFEDALVEFSVLYADQNERDHAALIKAIRSGKVEANPE